MQFTVDIFAQISLDTVRATNLQTRCVCGQNLNGNGPAYYARPVWESTAVVGLADRPLDQSRASRHLRKSMRDATLHRVLDGFLDGVSVIRCLGICEPF
jgi:hypothetical protein